MKPFESFKMPDVKRVSPDKGLADALWKDARQRSAYVLTLPVTAQSSTLIFENLYESIRQCADALLARDGYKSYSHIASIAFLTKFSEFTEADIAAIDNAREKRNYAKYYGAPITLEETQTLAIFFKKIKPVFEKLHAKAF